jgi:ABC-2 type transport system permease protein
LSPRLALRTVRAVAAQDLKLSLIDRLPTVLGLIIPVNFLLLFILFVLSGGQAPTALVLEDTGPLARQFVSALERTHSFQLRQTSAADADRLLHEGRIVAVITVPAGFDGDLAGRRPIQIPVQVNNLQVDFTNDIRRAVPLAITGFYADAFPDQVVVRAQEVDVQASDTGYVPYLAVSIIVVAFLITGMLQGSLVAAREFELGTLKVLLLSPAPRWAIGVGKLLAAMTLNLAASLIVLAIVVFVLRVPPLHPLELALYGVLLLLTCSSLGVLVGMLLKRRAPAIPLAIAISLPTFFLSGPFGPPGWLGGANALLAAASPLTYAIALFQHAFHGYQTYPGGTGVEVAVLAGFTLAALALVARTLTRVEVR